MNQRSKRAWIENVAWTLVVSMSVLQLIGGWQWKAAQAGQFECNTTVLTPRVSLECTGCSDAACSGGWREASRYEICELAAKGHWLCEPLDGPGVFRPAVGEYGDCVEQYSLIAITICAGSGVAAGIYPCLVGCASFAPTGPGYPACVALCLTGSGGGAALACCSQSCFCVTRCYKGVATKLREPRVDLRLPGCPAQSGGG